jgi:hypothetical protein
MPLNRKSCAGTGRLDLELQYAVARRLHVEVARQGIRRTDPTKFQ